MGGTGSVFRNLSRDLSENSRSISSPRPCLRLHGLPKIKRKSRNRDARDLVLATCDPCVNIGTLEALDSMDGLQTISRCVRHCLLLVQHSPLIKVDCEVHDWPYRRSLPRDVFAVSKAEVNDSSRVYNLCSDTRFSLPTHYFPIRFSKVPLSFLPP